MIDFECPNCSNSLHAPDTAAGKRAKCKSCQQACTVPNSAATASIPDKEPKPKSGSFFARLPVAVKVLLGLCVIALASYGIYDSMPSIRELEMANAERERLNQKIAEPRGNQHAKLNQEHAGGEATNAIPATIMFQPGEDIVLQSPQGGYVRVYPTSKDWDDAATLAARNDEDGLISMALQGRILSNKSGTPAKYLRSGFEAYEVRIKGGEYDRLSGWVLKDHVAKLGTAAPARPAVVAQPPSTPPVPIAGQPAPPQPNGARPAPGPQPLAVGVTMPNGDLRAKWVNDTYKDRIVRRDDAGAWQEVDKNTGAIIWEEKETSRTKEYVEVFCPKRSYEIRMFDDRMELKKDGKWIWVANGRWADAR